MFSRLADLTVRGGLRERCFLRLARPARAACEGWASLVSPGEAELTSLYLGRLSREESLVGQAQAFKLGGWLLISLPILSLSFVGQAGPKARKAVSGNL